MESAEEEEEVNGYADGDSLEEDKNEPTSNIYHLLGDFLQIVESNIKCIDVNIESPLFYYLLCLSLSFYTLTHFPQLLFICQQRK